MDSKEPYRATRLWNEVIAAFQSGMPLKKHRRRIQTYNNCFTASEAVTWLHCYLMNNPNFGTDVTRQQSVNLLQKFLKCHVIESIVIRSKKKEFSDDSHLYRFSSLSSQHSKPSALCLIQSPSFGVRSHRSQKEASSAKKSPHFQKENLPECHIVERKLSPDEVKLMWRKVTLSRLEKLLSFASMDDILDEKAIDGHLIKHNVSRLSKTGVVCLVDKTDDVPSWVISAMKCLANWPNASGSGSCLPNYPGFEKDVFKVVRDFFINPQVPLIPAALTLSLIKVFCHFTQQRYVDPNNQNAICSMTSELSYSSKISHSTSSTKIKTSTPVSNNESSRSNQLESIHASKETSHGKLLLDDPEIMWEYPSAVFYETDFATSDPITRVVSDHCTPRSRSSSYGNSIDSIDSVSTISVCSQNHTFTDDLVRIKSPLKAWSSNLYLQDKIRDPMDLQAAGRDFSRLEASSSTSRVINEPLMHRSHSLTRYSCEPEVDVYSYEINDLDVSNLSTKTVIEVDGEVESGVGRSLQSICHSSGAISTRNSSQINQTSQRYINRSSKKEIVYSQELKSSFQLILLLLPSANRRQLHLLLRLLNKVLKNGKFVLNVKTSMRDYLLETFLPAIMQFEDNQMLLLQMAAFLLDECEILFQTPTSLKEEVEDLSRSCYGRELIKKNDMSPDLSDFKRGLVPGSGINNTGLQEIKYSVDDTCFLSYCELVSKQQYEEQRLSASAEALKDLLNTIMRDPKMTEKERKRKIKQFKEIHPEVYHLQFPEKQEYPLKPKQTLFTKLANLRI